MTMSTDAQATLAATYRMPYGYGLSNHLTTDQDGNLSGMPDYLAALADRLRRQALLSEAMEKELTDLRRQRQAMREFLGTNQD